MSSAPVELETTVLQELLQHEEAYYAILGEPHERVRWLAFRNRKIPRIYDANHAGRVRLAPGEEEGFLEELEAFYGEYGAAPAVYLDPLSRPEDLAGRLSERGYRRIGEEQVALFLYRGGPLPEPRPEGIRLQVATYQQWRHYVQVASGGVGSAGLRAQFAWRAHLECADPRVRNYIAYVDGQAAGVACLFAWEGMGRLESVRTEPAFRERGVASALTHKAVYDSLNMKNRLTYVFAALDSQAQRVYQRQGFALAQADGWEGWVLEEAAAG